MRRLIQNLILSFFLSTLVFVPCAAIAAQGEYDLGNGYLLNYDYMVEIDTYNIQKGDTSWVDANDIYAKLVDIVEVDGLYKVYPNYQSNHQKTYFLLNVSDDSINYLNPIEYFELNGDNQAFDVQYFFYVYAPNLYELPNIANSHLAGSDVESADNLWPLGCFKFWLSNSQGKRITARIPLGKCSGYSEGGQGIKFGDNYAQWGMLSNNSDAALVPVLVLSDASATVTSNSIQVIPSQTSENENSESAQLSIANTSLANGQNPDITTGEIFVRPENSEATSVLESEPLYFTLDIPGNDFPKDVHLVFDGGGFLVEAVAVEPFDSAKALSMWNLGGNNWKGRIIPSHTDFAGNPPSEGLAEFTLSFRSSPPLSIKAELYPVIESSPVHVVYSGQEQQQNEDNSEVLLQKITLLFSEALNLDSLAYGSGNKEEIVFVQGRCEGINGIETSNLNAVCVSVAPFEWVMQLDAKFVFEDAGAGKRVSELKIHLTQEDFTKGPYLLSPQVIVPLATLELTSNPMEIDALAIQENLTIVFQQEDSNKIIINYNVTSKMQLNVLFEGEWGDLEKLETFSLGLELSSEAGFNFSVTENPGNYLIVGDGVPIEVVFDSNTIPTIQILVAPETVVLPSSWRNVAQLPSNQNHDPNEYCSVGLRFSSNAEIVWLKRDKEQFILDEVPNEITLGDRDLPADSMIEIVVRPNPDIPDDYRETSQKACAEEGTIVRQVSAETLAGLDTLDVPFARPVFVYFLRSRASDSMFGGGNLDVYGYLLDFFSSIQGERVIELRMPNGRNFVAKSEPQAADPSIGLEFEKRIGGPVSTAVGPSVELIFADIEQRKTAYGLADIMWPDVVIVSFGSITENCNNFIQGLRKDIPGSRVLVINNQQGARIIDSESGAYWSSQTCKRSSAVELPLGVPDYQVTLVQTDILYLLDSIGGQFNFEEMSHGTRLFDVLDGLLSPAPFEFSGENN